MKKIIILEVLMILGIVISGILIKEHFVYDPNSICKINSVFDCGTVNKSPYSTIYGTLGVFGLNLNIHNVFLEFLMTNGFLAVLMFGILLLMLYYERKGKKLLWIENKKLKDYEKIIISLMLLYGLGLVYIQQFILHAYCIFCLTLDAIILGSFILIWKKK